MDFELTMVIALVIGLGLTIGFGLVHATRMLKGN